MRQDDLPGGDLKILNLIHNFLCIGNCLRVLCKQIYHFLRCFQEFLPCVMHAGCIVEVSSCIETDKDTVGIVIVGIDKMHIIGGDHFNIMFSGHLYEDLIHQLLFRMSMVLQFQVKIFPKDLKVFQQHRFCLFLSMHPYNSWYLTAKAGR